jgi:ATP-dependent DNA helicase RecQ (EC 3.6.1.-)
VLLGHASDKVQQWGHDKLAVFGVGADLNEKGWRAVFRQLVAQGLMGVDHDAFGALTLTAESRAVLKGETTVWLRQEVAVKTTRKSRRPIAAPDHPADDALFEKLRCGARPPRASTTSRLM